MLEKPILCISTPGGTPTQRRSTIDHVHGVELGSTTVTVEDFTATDHRPVKFLLRGMFDPPQTLGVESKTSRAFQVHHCALPLT